MLINLLALPSQLTYCRVSWNQYTDYPSVSALKEALWNAETSPPFVDELRSICWKICLLFQAPLAPSTCLPILRDSRAAYASLRAHFLKAIDNPGAIDDTGSDPLSEDEQVCLGLCDFSQATSGLAH
jgi:TBC1 domain family protein 5